MHEQSKAGRLEGDLVPFDVAIAAGAPVVMVGHLQSPGLTEPGVPVTLSSTALRYLRGKAGPATVIVTDDLVMAASSSALGIRPETAAVRASTRRLLAVKQTAGLLGTPLVSAAPLGELDDVRPSGAWVRTVGWALDPDTPAPSAVHVQVDGELARAATADTDRPDVGEAHAGAGDRHGFDVALRLPAGPHEVCVLAVNTGAGEHTPLGCRTVTTEADVAVPLPEPCDCAASARFADVPDSAWYAPSLDCAVEHQLVRGTTSQFYAPEGSVTRAQAASLLHRLLTRTDHRPAAVTAGAFGDDDGSVHEEAIDALAALGIIDGTAPGRYQPDAPVTRAQLASLLVRLQETVAGPMQESATGFEDVAGVHAVAVGKAAAASLTTGTTPWTFAPGDPVRRDATAVFVARALGSLDRAGVLRP